jgi:hypothetical protein
VLCTLFGNAEVSVSINNQDVTPQFQAYLHHEIPHYDTYRTAGVWAGGLLAVGLIVSGIGLLRAAPWARFLALGCAVLAVLEQAAVAAFQLLVVNPAAAHFFTLFGPVNFGFLYSFVTGFVVAGALTSVLVGVILIGLLLARG